MIVPFQEATSEQLQELLNLIDNIVPINLQSWIWWAEGREDQDPFFFGMADLEVLIGAIRANPYRYR